MYYSVEFVFILRRSMTILEEQFESMRSWVDYIRRTDQKNHCWRQEFHYGDWLALDHPTGGENGFLGGTDERFIADVSYAVSAGIVKKQRIFWAWKKRKQNMELLRMHSMNGSNRNITQRQENVVYGHRPHSFLL